MIQFERVVCVSLKRHLNRRFRFEQRLPADWPFGSIGSIEFYPAIDGKHCCPPGWWKAGSGAWGCYRSHLNILEDCLNRSIYSCLVLEDDATFRKNFAEEAAAFFSELPEDWGMIYLGGQHLFQQKHPPKQLSPRVQIPHNVNRTHAYALQGKQAMRTVYRHLCDFANWRSAHHIDHHLGRLHGTHRIPIYTPTDWLVGQSDGLSSISGSLETERFFS